MSVSEVFIYVLLFGSYYIQKWNNLNLKNSVLKIRFGSLCSNLKPKSNNFAQALMSLGFEISFSNIQVKAHLQTNEFCSLLCQIDQILNAKNTVNSAPP